MVLFPMQSITPPPKRDGDTLAIPLNLKLVSTMLKGFSCSRPPCVNWNFREVKLPRFARYWLLFFILGSWSLKPRTTQHLLATTAVGTPMKVDKVLPR